MVRTGLFQRVLMAAVAVACGTSVAAAGIVDAGGEPDPSFTDLVVWVKSDADVYTDAGTTPATNGQAVQQWNNQVTGAAASSHASELTNKPIFLDGSGDAINGVPVIRFDGSNDRLRGTLTIPASKTMIAVLKPMLSHSACCSGAVATDGNYNNISTFAHTTTGGEIRTRIDWNGSGQTGAADITGTPVVAALTWSTTTSPYGNMYVNGVLDGTEPGNRAAAGTLYQLGLRTSNASSQAYHGDIAEVLIYDGVLTATQQDALGSYLGTKYGIDYQTRTNALRADGTPNANADALKLWLKSEADVYNVADTTPAADGQTVAQWKNQALGAPANSHATGGANQPTLESGAGDLIGGLPVVRFDGVNDELGGALAVTAEKTIFAVMMDTGTQTTCCSGGVWTNGGDNALGTKRSGSESRLNLDWSGSGRTGPTDITNQAIVAALTWNTTGSVYGQIFLNGVTEDMETSSHAAAGSAYKLGTRGTDGPAYGRWFKGDYAEILIYDGQLGPVTRFQISQYLGAKYGIAVSGAIDEVMGSTAQISTPENDPAFGSASKVLAAVNFYNNTLGTVGQGGPGDNGTVGSDTILGVGFDDIYVGAAATNGIFSLTANGSAVTLTTNMQSFSNREQTATIAGTDGAAATRMITDLKELTAGQTNELTFGGLGRETELFVQLFGGDADWGADLDVYANGTLVGRWTTVADGLPGTASTFGFFTTADAGGQLLLRLDAINVGGPDNANVAGLAGLMITMRVPEPSTLVLALLGGVGLVVGRWRRRRRAAQ